MKLIALRCPSCGGEIQLDDSKEIGFCMYCGSKVAIQDNVNKSIKIDESHKIESWKTLGMEAIKTNNYDDADKYANKIIEVDIKNPYAWYIKGCCATIEEVAKDFWKKALSYSDDEIIRKLCVDALNDFVNHFRLKIRTVQIIRKRQFVGSINPIRILVGNEEKGIVKNGQSISFSLREGSYSITAKATGAIASVNLDINDKNRTIYVQWHSTNGSVQIYTD